MNSMPTSAETHEDEVKRAAELKEWLETKIPELEFELLRLREMMALVDSTLRKSSFVPAAVLRGSPEMPRLKAQKETVVSEDNPPAQKMTEPIAVTAASESSDQQKQLRRSKDGKILANAYIESEKIVIVPEQGNKFSQVTPPFQSFFLNRILKGYQIKDEEQSKSGSLSPDQVLTFNVQETDGNISSITVTNYRERVRLNEILSTATWAFTRMLEKR